jgi:hypothetical protein
MCPRDIAPLPTHAPQFSKVPVYDLGPFEVFSINVHTPESVRILRMILDVYRSNNRN